MLFLRLSALANHVFELLHDVEVVGIAETSLINLHFDANNGKFAKFKGGGPELASPVVLATPAFELGFTLIRELFLYFSQVG